MHTFRNTTYLAKDPFAGLATGGILNWDYIVSNLTLHVLIKFPFISLSALLTARITVKIMKRSLRFISRL